MATLAGMLLANVGVLPASPPQMHVVYKYLLPLAIPLLLFSADLRCVRTAKAVYARSAALAGPHCLHASACDRPPPHP